MAVVNETSGGGGEERHYLALLLVAIPFLTIVGNILVVLSVLRERSLQSVTNYFIVSLAVADFLVALCVMPFAVYIEVNALVWRLDWFMCNVWIACDVCASTSSILNLLSISIDRYFAITRPILYSRHGKKMSRASITIAIVWLISMLIASPIMLGINTMHNENTCEFTNPAFIIGSSLCSFFIPCIVMMILYAVILKRLRDRERKKRLSTMFQRRSNLPSEERLGTALLGGANLAKQMGRRFRAQAVALTNELTVRRQQTYGCRSEPRAGVRLGSRGPPSSTITRTRALLQSASPRRTSDETDEDTTSSHTPVADGSAVPTSDCYTSPSLPPPPPPLNRLHVVGIEVEGATDLSVASELTDRSFGEELVDLPHIDSACSSRGASVKQPHAPTLDPNSIEDFPLALTPQGSLRVGARLADTGSGPGRCAQMQMVVVCAAPAPSGSAGASVANGRDKPMPVAAAERQLLLQRSRSTTDRRQTLTESLRRVRRRFWRRITNMRLKTLKPTSRHLAKKEQRHIRKERKATVTLAVVLAVFLICWVPFFTLHLSNSICLTVSGQACVGFVPFFITTWLGYMNSFMNPIIYTTFNPEYRKAFRRLLTCQRA